MADEFDGFDWDAANVAHIIRHQVTPLEVEEAVGQPHLIFPHPRLGARSGGSYLARPLDAI
jgi:hypothetical protein